MPAKQEARIIVDPVDCLLQLLFGNGSEVCSFREEPAYHLVLLFVAPALSWVSGMAVVDGGTLFSRMQEAALHAFNVRELVSIVHSDAFENLTESICPHFGFHLIQHINSG